MSALTPTNRIYSNRKVSEVRALLKTMRVTPAEAAAIIYELHDCILPSDYQTQSQDLREIAGQMETEWLAFNGEYDV
jgi:hypothetical protein